MMGIGAAIALASVVGGYWCTRLAFRGPSDQLAAFVVGGFLFRLVLLVLGIVVLSLAAGISPTRFLLWMVGFYFALILAEAWIVVRQGRVESTPEAAR